MSMEKPPSPAMAITCRAVSGSCAPMAWGMAFAIEPCVYEPIMRRRPLGLR